MQFMRGRSWGVAVGVALAWLVARRRWSWKGTVNDVGRHPKDLNESRIIGHVEPMLTAAREELSRADMKASILLTATGAVIAAIVAGAVAGDWSPTRLTGWREVLWWVATAAAGSAVLLLAAAVYPRTKRPRGSRPDTIAYYGDLAIFAGHEELRAALEQSAVRDVDRLTDQVYQVGRIVARKYRLLAAGMWALLIAAVGCCLAVALEAWR
jgi:hypothetical protein